jgi:hypothetical protein
MSLSAMAEQMNADGFITLGGDARFLLCQRTAVPSREVSVVKFQHGAETM